MRIISELADHLLQKGVPSAELEVSHDLTLHLLSEDRPFIRKFILNMVTNIPLRNAFPDRFSLDRVKETLLFATVHFNESSPELHTYFERILYELELGVRSPYHAARILEMKVLSMDEKRGLIQDRILGAIRRFPNLFDYDLFSEMQQFFLTFSDQYFRVRSVKEVSQTLMALNRVRKKVLLSGEKAPKQRHVEVKVKRRHLNFPLGHKEALEVVIGMNILRENELFKKSHLLKAIQNILPKAELVVGSDYLDKEGEDPLHLIALEIEKEGGFEPEEISDLKRWLPRALKGKVEHLQRALFMPRNEEEILKYVVTLGQELRFARDLPQVILSFEKQTETKLIFTVILARLLLPNSPPLEDVLLASPLRPKIDRIKQLGMLRKKYPKEAAVFKVELPLNEFLREDHSIDLYKARQNILHKLHAIFGEIRDYNGGMISKQNEVFKALEKTLGSIAMRHHHLLENFFHSLFPLEKRSFLDPKLLKNLFLLLLEKMQTQQDFVTKEEEGQFFIVGDNATLEKFQDISNSLITLDLEYDERTYHGLITNFDNIRGIGL
ncbi:MAG: hypothetical protein KFB93_03895 [Simkaniaceae bacterium]|nr:MAG: hypothetical protein KFB93_03895 [Simkaniaceae bacterium]